MFHKHSKHRSTASTKFHVRSWPPCLHALKELQEEATGVRLACITTTQCLLATIPQPMAPVNSISLLGHFQLDSVQTTALREGVYSFVKRVPLVYPLHSIYDINEYPLQHFTIMQVVPPAQTGEWGEGGMKEEGAGRRRGSGEIKQTGGGERERVLGGGEGVGGISEQVAGRGSRDWERDEMMEAARDCGGQGGPQRYGPL